MQVTNWSKADDSVCPVQRIVSSELLWYQCPSQISEQAGLALSACVFDNDSSL